VEQLTGSFMSPLPACDRGKVLPGSASELRELGNEALKNGEDARAAQMYTMAIDVATMGMPRDENGVAKPEDLRKQNDKSNGELVKLLSNRSAVYLRQKDVPAALEDAQACTDADAKFEKGHLRLLMALDAAAASLSEREAACTKAVEACPDSQYIRTRWERLQKERQTRTAGAGEEDRAADQEKSSPELDSSLALTRRLADDPSDARHVMAAADLGAAMAVGAYGVEKDLKKAEHYLRIGASGGDMMAQRNLGWLLLETERPVEAVESLRQAAEAGDEEAAATIQRLVQESEEQAKVARSKLEMMAAAGEERAIEMLKELSIGGA